MNWSEPWCNERVAIEQRALVDKQLSEAPWPAHLNTFVAAIKIANCPGTVLEIGCASGYGRELLDRSGVEYRDYVGVDNNPHALALARERYPESRWLSVFDDAADIVVDGCALMHIEEWRQHVAALCRSSRRWVVLHRVPVNPDRTYRFQTEAYGQKFPAWSFQGDDLVTEMQRNGFELAAGAKADGESMTFLFGKPRHFVTYFDEVYWTRARAMWRSLKLWSPGAVLHALCWGDEAFAKAKAAGMQAVHVSERLEFTRDLPGPERTRVERMWTAGAQWVAECAKAVAVTYVDADVMFHSSPEPLLAEWGDTPLGVVSHGFARAALRLPGPTWESHVVFGRYNVGIVHVGKSGARQWARDCRDWCYDRLEDDRYGDQKYLERYDLEATSHPGACLGPWAVHTRALDVRGGVIHFGNKPLIAYHYSAYRELPEGHTVMTRPEYQLTRRQEEILYRPYIEALAKEDL